MVIINLHWRIFNL